LKDKRVDQEELNQLLKEMLTHDACQLGWVPYSGLDTLKPGPYYFMAYNPRTDPANRPLLETTNNARDWSAYTQQCWQCPQERCEHMDAAGRLNQREPHQNRVIELAGLLGKRPECIFSANAIFVQSPKAKDLQNPEGLWRKCWAVHQEFLAIVRPKWIICLGNGKEQSSFQLMRQKAEKPEPKVSNPCHADRPPDYRMGKLIRACFDIGETSLLENVNVLGVPHPSRFPIPVCLKHFIEKNVRQAATPSG
jgi:hypothetical protein